MSRNAAILGVVGPNEPIVGHTTRRDRASRGEGLRGDASHPPNSKEWRFPLKDKGAPERVQLVGSAPESKLGGLKLLEVSFGLWKTCTTNEGNRRIPSYVVGHKLTADWLPDRALACVA